MPDRTSWVEVVGYGHEVLHTGVLADLLGSEDDGAAVAAELTGPGRHEIASVSEVRREARLDGARGKADLTAKLHRVDGRVVGLAVETKVHSDGSLDQLRRTTGNSVDSEGVLLAVGLTSLMLRPTQFVGIPERWSWVGPEKWHRILVDVADPGRPWLAPYRESVRDWRKRLGEDHVALLAHLEWMNEVLGLIDDPRGWREIRTSRSGPLLTRFGWHDERGNDAYLEFMGHAGGRRDLRLKVGSGRPEELERLADRLGDLAGRPGWRALRVRTGKASRTVACCDDLGADVSRGAAAFAEASRFLDERLP